MRDTRPEYSARSAHTADASDNGPQHPARHGQNDCEIVLNRKNAIFAGHDVGASYCSSDDALIMEGDFGDDPEMSDAWIA
jgi:hypothetical protein